MTVNERLSALGLFPEFDCAATARDRAALLKVLIKAHLSEEQAIATVEAFLHEPAKYGF